MAGRVVPKTLISAVAVEVLLLAAAATAAGGAPSPIRGACYTGTFGGAMRAPKNWVVDRATPAEVRHPGRFVSDVGVVVSIINIRVERKRDAIDPWDSGVSPAFRKRGTFHYWGNDEWNILRNTTWIGSDLTTWQPIPPVMPSLITNGRFTSTNRARDTAEHTYSNDFVRGHFGDHGRRIVGVLRWQSDQFVNDGWPRRDSGWLRFTARAGDPFLCEPGHA